MVRSMVIDPKQTDTKMRTLIAAMYLLLGVLLISLAFITPKGVKPGMSAYEAHLAHQAYMWGHPYAPWFHIKTEGDPR